MTFALLLLAAAATADGPKPGVAPAAAKALEGQWALTARTHGGEKAEAKAIQSIRLSVSGTTLTTREGDEVKEEAAITLLDPTAKPGAIDLKITKGPGKGDVVHGIYKADAATLTLCIAEPGRDRPTRFEGARGTGHTLLVLTRVKK